MEWTKVKGKVMKDIYIIGAGGFGREVAWLIERINEKEPTWNLKGFIDDNEEKWGTTAYEYPVIGGCDYLLNQGTVCAVCAIGASIVRKKIVKKFQGSDVEFVTLIDPSVIKAKNVQIGIGSIVCPGSILSVDITIGNHVIINWDCTVGHDDILEDYVTLYPSVNVSGMTKVGECTELGTGTQIIQGKTIGSNAIIGAGTVVVKDIQEPGTYVGSPARKIK